jgi:hypothetical protein
MDMKRLRDLLLTILGLWLILSPRFLHIPTAHAVAAWNTWVLGAALILLTSVCRYLLDARTPWEDIAGAVLGFWLMIAPWALGFADYGLERSNSLIVGFLVAGLALWATVIDANLIERLDHRMSEHHS